MVFPRIQADRPGKREDGFAARGAGRGSRGVRVRRPLGGLAAGALRPYSSASTKHTRSTRISGTAAPFLQPANQT